MATLTELIRLEKHKWIRDHVKGLNFIDIGGLWGTVNETVSIASMAGAKSITMSDIQPFSSEWWQKFDSRCNELGIEGCERKILDICDTFSLQEEQNYDFVHCSGIMYHVSDPIQYVRNVVSMSSKYVLITSLTIPEKIQNDFGELITTTGSARLIHSLTDEHRRILEQYFEGIGMKSDVVAKQVTRDLFRKDNRVKTGPWWWLYTPAMMESLCELSGIKILKTDTNKVHAHSVFGELSS